MNGMAQIYGKTYGASKKETALMCVAVSRLARQVELYEICEQNLSVLPETDLEVIKNLGNVQIIQTDYAMERKEFEEYNSLRSPLFKYNLLEKLGPKKCALCDCEIPELIESAHIWPVHKIKNTPGISFERKIEYATDGDYGIWLCENHQKLFDEGFIIINSEGAVQYDGTMKDEHLKFVIWATTITAISREILTKKFCEFLAKRYETRL
jgi:predicted restriction endonuclease